MPNVTISVPEELKAQMDRFPEVSWSEVCRKAITGYIDQRRNPAPNIELDLRNARVTSDAHETGRPTLSIDLRIHNKMDSEIMVDRILSTARFVTQDGPILAIGRAYDLYKRNIGSNSIGGAQIHLILPKEKISELEGVFTSTFTCNIHCIVFAEGFKNPYSQEVKTRIPIDDWNRVVGKILKTYQGTGA